MNTKPQSMIGVLDREGNTAVVCTILSHKFGFVSQFPSQMNTSYYYFISTKFDFIVIKLY